VPRVLRQVTEGPTLLRIPTRGALVLDALEVAVLVLALLLVVTVVELATDAEPVPDTDAPDIAVPDAVPPAEGSPIMASCPDTGPASRSPGGGISDTIALTSGS
jgi:hypothetical protein